MKTTLQQVFSELERLHPSLFDIHTAKGKGIVDHFYKYLVMEKEQMRAFHLMTLLNKNFDFEQYYKEYFEISIQSIEDKEYRVWIEDSVEEEGGSWWYCKQNVFGQLYDPEYPSEDHDTLEWYLQNGYKVQEVNKK